MPFEIEVFKPGEYPQGSFSVEQVRQLVDDYDPNFLKARVSVDHEWGGPKLGDVTALTFDGEVVTAEISDLHPWLYGAVKRKEYEDRSVEILERVEETGRPYLSAVSFLGLLVPQVKGMAPPQLFSQPPEKRIFTFEGKEIIEAKDTKNKGGGTVPKPESKFKEALKKLFTGAVDELDEKEFGLEGAGTTEPPARQAQTMTEPDGVDVEEIVATNTQLAADLKTARAELAESEEATRREEIHTFCDGLLREGKLTPAMEEAGIEKFMLSLGGLEGKQKFADKDKAERTPGEFFRDLLNGMPKLVEFGEVAGEEETPPSVDLSKKYPGATEESIELAEKAQAFAQANDVSYKEALVAVMTEEERAQ